MGAIGEYLVGVTAAALLCSLVGKLGFGKLNGGILKLLCGAFMALAVLAPWRSLRLELPSELLSDFQTMGDQAAEEGENSAREAMAEIISQQTRAYILDKAASLDMDLTVEVTLSDDEIPAPVGVTLRGSASPYGKDVLRDYIQDQLGIKKEAQIWIS